LRIDIEPVEEKDGGMVINMEEGKLSPFLSNYNENGVPEIPDFRNVKEPKKVRNWRRITVILVARNTVITAICDHECFNGHVSTQKNLRNIVDKLYGIGIHSRKSHFHCSGSKRYE